jgi:hypothetical protein
MKRVRTFAVVALACLGAGPCSSGSDRNPFSVTHTVTITLNPSSASKYIGEQQTFTVAGDPTYGAPSITGWSIAPFETVARLNIQLNPGSSQTATCMAQGTATITATPSATGEVLATGPATSSITCLYTQVSATSTSVGGPGKQLSVGAGDGSNAVTNSTFAWSSANPSNATVTASGFATPVSPGSVPVSVTQVVDGTTYPVATGVFFVTGNGTCSLNPSSIVAKPLTFRVQSDPGNHASQIGFPATPIGPVTFALGSFASTNMQISVGGGTLSAPMVAVNGGWVTTGDCNFVANGSGAIGGLQNVGVQLKGVWSNGALTLTYTVGTNGELTGGATVYTVTG